MPELPDYLRPYLDAFWILSPGRALGFGAVGAIPLADVWAYWQAHPLCGAVRFFRLVRELDHVYMTDANDKLAAKNGTDDPRR